MHGEGQIDDLVGQLMTRRRLLLDFGRVALLLGAVILPGACQTEFTAAGGQAGTDSKPSDGDKDQGTAEVGGGDSGGSM